MEEYKGQVEDTFMDGRDPEDIHITSQASIPQDYLPDVVIYSDGQIAWFLRPNQANPYSGDKVYFPIKDEKLALSVYRYLDRLVTLTPSQAQIRS